MRRYLFICALCMASLSSVSAAAQTAEEFYNQYISATKTATSLDALDIYLSQSTLSARDGYIERIMRNRDKTRSEVESILLERAKYRENCTKNRQLTGQSSNSANSHVLKYRFEDGCNQNSQAIVATIAEVTLVKEGDMWKIDNTTARPEAPTKLRKVVPLEQ